MPSPHTGRTTGALLSALLVLLASLTVLTATTGPSRAAGATISVDNYRTGWDQDEPGLTPAQVSSSDFGRQYSTPVDGQVYASPVVVGGTVVVATETNHVYGIDAATGDVKWTVSYGAPWPASGVTTPGATWSCADLAPSMGITSTPVHDPASGYVYLTSKEDGGQFHEAPIWRMHAVDPATGKEKAGFPVVIGGTPDNDPSTPFAPVYQNQRPGLLLLNGVVYAGFGGICDQGNWRGYVVGVDTTGRQTAMWASQTGPGQAGGGIWHSGGGLVADAQGRLLFSTGNGVSPPPGPGDSAPTRLAESVVALSVRGDGKLETTDFFSPADAETLDLNDVDLGSGAVMAIPDEFGTGTVRHLAVTEGKDGRVFLLDRDDLGGRGQGVDGTDAVVQTLGPYQGCYGHPAFWGGDTGYVYFSQNGGPLQAFKLGTDGTGRRALALVGASAINSRHLSAGSPVVSSAGRTPGSAVVWLVRADDMFGRNGALYAYDGTPNADGTMNLLWSGPVGTSTKFSTPVTDNGRVFVGTRDGHLVAFGRPAASALTGQPVTIRGTALGASGTADLTVTATKPLTVTHVGTTAPFAVSTPSLPRTMAAGDTLTVPVTFSPTAPGTAPGIITLETDAGALGFSVIGTAVKGGLSALPGSVSFPKRPTGVPVSASVQFTNTGTENETIGALGLPSAPWGVRGLPAAGTVIAPGASFVASVTYTPTTVGSSTDTLSVTTASGTVAVPLSGTAMEGRGHLVITPTSLAFGAVPVGTTSRELSFTLTNDGNISIFVNKAKAPTGTFSSSDPVSEGIDLGPGQSVSVPITFTPPYGGDFSDGYTITAGTDQGAMTVTLTGTGVS
ncbi:choice-of-anchor D domain-containing protein [Kitasatospora sp. NPDC098652]|uniref:choice-of-anchor D domain-containing protein n=1 Tax=Kitasatospora sp. NPDC098652 TaxID=3364095 RepID=UPI003810F6F0